MATYTSQRPPKGSAALAQLFGIPIAPKGEIDMADYRPNALNQPPRFKQAMQTGKVLLGTGLGLASIEVAKITAQLNFDWCFIDCEHTPMSPGLMADLIRTIHYYSEGSCAAVVRLPTHGHEWIAWALDAGAAGIILPHSETVEQAKHAVQSARFGPKGKRSFPPFALLPGHNDGTPEGKTMFDVWNDNAVIIMQIESALGVKNAHDIAAVDGIDALMVGPADLRFDMGLPGMDGTEPEFLEALKTVERASKENNIPIAGFAFTPMIKRRIAEGWTVLMTAADFLALVAGQTGALVASRAAVQEALAERDSKPNGEANGHAQ